MNIRETLGITENELKVYKGFNSYPLKTAAEISRLLKMDKSSTYKAVDGLLSKGLLIREKWEKGFRFSASNPETLKNVYKQRIDELKSSRSQLDILVDELKARNNNTRLTYLSIDKGIEGLMLRITESLECKEKLIRELFHHHEVFTDKRYVEFVIESANQRSSKGIFIRQLEDKNDVEQRKGMFDNIMTRSKKYLKEVRLIPHDYTDKNSIRIWDDSAFILSYDDNGDFIVLTIKDKYIVTLLKSMYDYIWNQSKPIKQK